MYTSQLISYLSYRAFLSQSTTDTSWLLTSSCSLAADSVFHSWWCAISCWRSRAFCIRKSIGKLIEVFWFKSTTNFLHFLQEPTLLECLVASVGATLFSNCCRSRLIMCTVTTKKRLNKIILSASSAQLLLLECWFISWWPLINRSLENHFT